MAIEKTLLLIKPDACARGLTPNILQKVTDASLTIQGGSILELGRGERTGVWLYAFPPTYAQIKALIGHLRTKNLDAYVRNLDFYMSGSIAVAVIEGEDAVAKLRKLIGATNPPDAAEGTIRRTFSTDSIELCTTEGRGLHNCVHASDSAEAAAIEISIFKDHIKPRA